MEKVTGNHKGMKWPEKVRAAATLEALLDNNLSAVSRKYNIPESTLRAWVKTVGDDGESIFSKVRADAIRLLYHRASMGALQALDGLTKQTEEEYRNYDICCKARRELDNLMQLQVMPDGQVTIKNLTAKELERRAQLLQVIADHESMSAAATCNVIRTLNTVRDRLETACNTITRQDGFTISFTSTSSGTEYAE